MIFGPLVAEIYASSGYTRIGEPVFNRWAVNRLESSDFSDISHALQHSAAAIFNRGLRVGVSYKKYAT